MTNTLNNMRAMLIDRESKLHSNPSHAIDRLAQFPKNKPRWEHKKETLMNPESTK